MEEKTTTMKTERKATLGSALFVMAVAIAILLTGVLVLKLDPHIPLLTAIIPISVYGIYLHISWEELMDSAYKSIMECMEAAILVLTIGMVVGSWIASGTVPFIIYWGVKLFSPASVLPLTLIFCTLMSTLTGSSWTTIGTLGVAFVGIGTALGINPAMIVGAICCGAFFGNAQSPMADVPVFSEAVANVEMYKGSKASLVSNIPALVITFVIFVVLGLQYRNVSASASAGNVETFLSGLQSGFNLTPAVLIPVICMVVLMIVKFPAIPLRFVAAFTGVACAVIFQHETLADTLGYMMNGYVGKTGVEEIDVTLTRGGLMGMTGTVIIMMFSMWMAGIIRRTGIVQVILDKVANFVKRPGILVATATISNFVFNFVAADPFFAITLPAKAFGDTFDELGYDRSILCRCISPAAYFAPMVPWGSGGIFVAATLGVSVAQYIPFYFTAIIAPILTIIYAFVGFAMPKVEKNGVNEKLASETN